MSDMPAATRTLAELVVRTGGEIEDGLFVTRPGCCVLAATALSPEADALFGAVRVDRARPPYEQLAEFNARLTYLSFPDAPRAAGAFNEKMARVHQHLSVHAATSVTFLLAGVAVETSMELLAHAEARVARLTTSKTRAMDRPLYRVQGTPAERAWQKALIREQLALRARFDAEHGARAGSPDGPELFNVLDAGAKATALTYTMTLKDFHKLFIGRLAPAGNEAEVREVCRRMCELLGARYPLVIRAPGEYEAMGNGAKYEGG